MSTTDRYMLPAILCEVGTIVLFVCLAIVAGVVLQTANAPLPKPKKAPPLVEYDFDMNQWSEKAKNVQAQYGTKLGL